MIFIKLVESIKNEENAVQFLQEKGILHNLRICVNSHDMKIYLENRQRRVCSKTQCRAYKRLRQDTYLMGSKLPFRKMVFFIYCWSKN